VKAFPADSSGGFFSERLPCPIAPHHSRQWPTLPAARPPPAGSAGRRRRRHLSCCGLRARAAPLSAPRSISSGRKLPQSFPSQEISGGEALSKQTKSSLVQQQSAGAYSCKKKLKRRSSMGKGARSQGPNPVRRTALPKRLRLRHHQVRPPRWNLAHKAEIQMLRSEAV